MSQKGKQNNNFLNIMLDKIQSKVVTKLKKQEILSVVESVKNLKKDKSNALPNSSYFLNYDSIVCSPNSYGDSRYPYDNDGLVLFAHSDGYIDCVQSLTNIFRPVHGGLEQNSLALYGGEPNGDSFTPISITGAEAQLEEKILERYTVFTPACAYYITETEKAIFAARVYVDGDKNIRVSIGAVNKAENRKIYLCAYMEPTLSDKMYDGIFFRMPRFAEQFENGNYILNARQANSMNYMNINLETNGVVIKRYSSVAKNSFMGKRGGTLVNATALKKGKFLHEVKRLNTVDWTVACDMIHFEFPENAFVSMDYMLKLTTDKAVAMANIDTAVNSEKADIELEKAQIREREKFTTKIEFMGDWKGDKLHSNTVNSFLRCVEKQTSFCALSKNFVGRFLGVRDVFQQLESALIWQPNECRAQIVRVMDYILEDGRAPRAVSFPVGDEVPELLLRPHIDQGFWIIATLHTYLSYTDDYSILDEICGYFKAEKTLGPVDFSDIKDSILCHLIKITDFLLSNVDEKTGCEKILFGDWNDALSGLGKTDDKDKEFGDGCSIMATFQMYLALCQMIDIIQKTTKDALLLERYNKYKAKIVKGVLENAIVENEQGFKRVIHGWGDKQSYYVGTFNDFDGKSRISVVSNAFAANSGMIYEFPEIKHDIAKNILQTDTKFGLLTFDEAFEPDTEPFVGNIAKTTIGTYENGCTYVHAGIFGIMALFLMGYAKDSWRILEKTMVISHENVTLSSFVMPNSYCQDDYYGFNGESMGDWYTGSGTALIKEVIRYAFGIEPTISTLKIVPANYFPTDKAKIEFNVVGKRVCVNYSNNNNGKRQIIINGKDAQVEYDAVRDTYFAQISKSDLENNNIIEIID